MNQLKQFHAHSLRIGTDFAKDLITKLLEIPNISYAHKVLDSIPNPTLSLYNKLIQAHSSHGPHSQCLSLYSQLLHRCLLPSPHSFTLLFVACAKLSSRPHGQMAHAHFLKFGLDHDVYALTALVDMYAKMGLLHLARKVFDEMDGKDVPTWNSLISGYARRGDLDEALRCFLGMPSRNVISWTALISGYSQNGRYREALEMYLEMEREGRVRPNHVTIASVLPACANLGALEVGQRIEAYARANGYFRNAFVCNAVLELYARCGVIEKAMQLFDEIGGGRNLCSWNSMIMGLAVHGRCHGALDLFNRMLREGFSPDDVTLVGVILACTHGGMVEQGRELFSLMKQKFLITPKLEHYGCMVDLLGRAGLVQEAYELIMGMPMKPDSVVWGALLGACSFHGNVEFAERAGEALFELEPWNPGNYVILSNIYAKAGKWEQVAKLRKFMKGSNTTKAAGHSFIEEGGTLHKFLVQDKCHSRSNDIFALLHFLTDEIKICGEIGFLGSFIDEIRFMESS
ncbi:pentatricopeptide repeat-containing protein At5g08510 [Salvia miltiorrhiza]|uniref:Pentatricopeptide repeat protein n=1 Tax=Salvia miltiorrhiza TaxID=226208 RepID=A0A678WFU6_SALMI|nr:pentatricopeptide repeat-containing protein At5g08510 [Salvia miltiorrhiza]XP_057800983.1 pentatricopeptide repeat-containing protein At5g08510 [Salvia miltiorrhiza]AYM00904.1 pentatricopeptide repeat protein [Salvia miltiorrhiza]